MTDSQQAEIDRLRGLMDELHDYITEHGSWRCDRYVDCKCGLDDLFDRCGWPRIPRNTAGIKPIDEGARHEHD